MTTSISEMERQEHEALAALKEEHPAAQIKPGCDHRYAVRVKLPTVLPGFIEQPERKTQWWEYDTLHAVRQRIVWALANR